MLLTPKGPINFNNISDSDDNDRLRGEKLSEIKNDMKNEDMDKKEKLMKYSTHLDWFMSKFKMLDMAHEAMQNPGKYDRSLISLGITNGLIMAMAIFLEERGDPPYRKIPEKLNGEAEAFIDEGTKSFIINLVTQLEGIICMGKDGKPNGYGDAEDAGQAWISWRSDTIDKINKYHMATPEINAAIKRIDEFNNEMFGDGSK